MRPAHVYAAGALLALAALFAVLAAGALAAEGRARVAACEAQPPRFVNLCSLESLGLDIQAAQLRTTAAVLLTAGAGAMLVGAVAQRGLGRASGKPG